MSAGSAIVVDLIRASGKPIALWLSGGKQIPKGQVVDSSWGRLMNRYGRGELPGSQLVWDGTRYRLVNDIIAAPGTTAVPQIGKTSAKQPRLITQMNPEYVLEGSCALVLTHRELPTIRITGKAGKRQTPHEITVLLSFEAARHFLSTSPLGEGAQMRRPMTVKMDRDNGLMLFWQDERQQEGVGGFKWQHDCQRYVEAEVLDSMRGRSSDAASGSRSRSTSRTLGASPRSGGPTPVIRIGSAKWGTTLQDVPSRFVDNPVKEGVLYKRYVLTITYFSPSVGKAVKCAIMVSKALSAKGRLSNGQPVILGFSKGGERLTIRWFLKPSPFLKQKYRHETCEIVSAKRISTPGKGALYWQPFEG